MHGFTYITMVFSMCPRWLLDRWIRDKNLIRLTGVFLFLLKLPPHKVAQPIDGTCVPCISTGFVLNLNLYEIKLVLFWRSTKMKKGSYCTGFNTRLPPWITCITPPIPGLYISWQTRGGRGSNAPVHI